MICTILLECLMRKPFREIILNLDQWFMRRRCLKLFHIYSSSSHFVPQNETICAILAEGFIKNINVKLL